MAHSKPVHSGDRSRFIRLELVILDELTPLLQDVLQSQIPQNRIFHEVLRLNSLYQRLGTKHTALIQNAQKDGYRKFDITLSYTILRNLTCLNVTAPTQGWGTSQMPGSGDITLGDDIERIRLIRNEVLGHSTEAFLSETEFKEHWSNISGICTRMQTLLGKNYVQRLQDAEVRPIDEEMENVFLEKIENLCASEKNVREVVGDVTIIYSRGS
jgi:hypothetical protein